jgi:excisionase family DNA binding protein
MDSLPNVLEATRAGAESSKDGHSSIGTQALYPNKFGGTWSMLLEENLSIEGKTRSRLLNAQDIAEALSIGLSTVYLLLERGELPCIRIGRSVRVRPEDLEEFIETRVQGKAAYE